MPLLSSSVASSPLGSPLPEPSKETAAAEGIGPLREDVEAAAVGLGCGACGWMWVEWWLVACALFWVGDGKGVVVAGCSRVSIHGGGTPWTMLGWKGATVVMVVAAATVALGVAAGGFGVGRSAGSEMVSGGGKGRKQGMDE